MNQQAEGSVSPDLERFVKKFQKEGWTFIDADDTDAELQRPALRAGSLIVGPDAWGFAVFIAVGVHVLAFFRWAVGRLMGLHQAVDRLHIQVTQDGGLIEERELIRISDYDNAIELNPGDRDAYYTRGIAHHVLGRHELAVADFDRVVELDRDNTDGYYRRALVRADKGAIDDAIADLEQALSVADDADDTAEIEELIEELRRAARPWHKSLLGRD